MIVPYLAYRDGAAALSFLEEAFGLERTAAFETPDGTLMHAEMRFGGCYMMLGTAAEERSGPTPAGNGIYLVVEDVDAHCERARAAGAEIVLAPEDTDFGTRQYRARDLDGYEWSFGSYRPGGS